METKKRIVIVGGGFGGLFTALELDGAGDVSLISAGDHFLFTPMLYEYLSGEVEAWHIAPRYKELLSGVKLIQGDVSNIDLTSRTVEVSTRKAPIPYDVLVIATGSVTNYADVRGAEEHSLPFRTLADADSLKLRMIRALDGIPPDADPGEAEKSATFAIAGGGASGIELSTKMADLLHDAFKRRGLPGKPRLLVVEMGDRIIPGMGWELREYVDRVLKKSGVEVHLRTQVVDVQPRSVTLQSEAKKTDIEVAGVVWVAGVKPNPLLRKLPLHTGPRGLIAVGPTLQAPGLDEVFALGDVADYKDADATLKGTGQLAVQESGLLAQNIRRFLQGQTLRTRHFSELGEALSLGAHRAAVLAGGHVLEGALGRQARFALYTTRLPTWHHRLRVGASWFFEGTSYRPLELRRP